MDARDGRARDGRRGHVDRALAPARARERRTAALKICARGSRQQPSDRRFISSEPRSDVSVTVERDGASDRRAMRATLRDIARWKREREARDTAVAERGVHTLDLHSSRVGEVVELMRATGGGRADACDASRACLVHESMPTTDGKLISIRSLFELFSRELADVLAGPSEPGLEDSAAAMDVCDEANSSETVGLVRSEHHASSRDERRALQNLPSNVLKSVFALPATRLAEFAQPLIESDASKRWTEALDLLDEREKHAIFFQTDDGNRSVVTAEDIVHFLGVEETLKRAVSDDCFDEKILFDSVRETFIVVHQDHNVGITAADCFLWLQRENVNACVYVESSFRIPGLHDTRGHIICELSVRDVLDLTPDNFVDIFNVDPVAYVSSKPQLHGTCRAVFVEGVSGSSAHSARRAIEKFAEKQPRRLPRRFYVVHEEKVRACTPLSILRTILACENRGDRTRAS